MMSGNKIINNPEYITELMSLREKNGANPYFRIGRGPSLNHEAFLLQFYPDRHRHSGKTNRAFVDNIVGFIGYTWREEKR
ncbi:hypothetical protein PBNK5_09740 [Pectobacterium brasiliense]